MKNTANVEPMDVKILAKIQLVKSFAEEDVSKVSFALMDMFAIRKKFVLNKKNVQTVIYKKGFHKVFTNLTFLYIKPVPSNRPEEIDQPEFEGEE